MLVLILLLLTLPLAAQQDVRISPEGTSEFYQPPESMIEAGARIGSRSIVVWGSSRQDGTTGNIRTLLRMQLLVGTTPAGAQRTLTSDNAEPFATVTVAALRDRFLVFWNDRRPGASGIYFRQVDTSGAILGAETRFTDHMAAIGYGPPTIAALGTSDDGYTIVWSKPEGLTSQRTLWARRVDALGRIDGDPTQLAGTTSSLVEILGSPYLPGSSILRLSRAPSWMVRDGRLDLRPIPAGHLDFHFDIASDTSIAVVDSGAVSFYRSIFDSIPHQRVPIAGLDRYFTLISRDSTGGYLLVYPRIREGGARARFTVERIRFDGTTSRSPEILFDRSFVAETEPDADSSSVSINYINWTRDCMNNRQLSIFVQFQRDVTNTQTWRQETHTYLIDPNGRVSEGVAGPMTSCLLPTALQVVRSDVDSLSRVVAIVDTSRVELTHVLEKVTRRVAETLPNTFERDGRLHLNWQIGSRAFMRIVDGSLASAPQTVSEFDATGTPLDLRGIQALLFTRRDSTTSGTGVVTHRLRFGINVATTGGWIYNELADRSDAQPPYMKLIDAAYDPNREELVTATESGDGQTRSLQMRGFTKDGGLSWAADMASPVHGGDFEIVPTGSKSFLLIGSETTYIVGNGRLVDSVALGSAPDVEYQRLLGDRILRSNPANPSGGYLLMEIYDLDLTGRHRQTIQIPTVEQRPSVVENPNDRTLALLLVSEGIRVTFIDSTLTPLPFGELVRVSSVDRGTRNPAGIFLNDTLQVVWEDYRNGEADIYGSWTRYSKPSAVREAPMEETMRLILAPNPSAGEVMLSIESKHAGAARLELVDPLGRSLLSREISLVAGRSTHRLDVDGVASGVYMVVVESSDGRTVHPLVVR